MKVREGALVLSDGSIFEGELIGAESAPVSSGEVVFHTALTGYQEVISDPSYAGQIVTFTTPHIGNYGTVAADDESRAVFARGVIVREMARRRSNWRSTEDLDAYLKRLNVSGISGVDTRRLTRILRDAGAMSGAFGSSSAEVLLDAARAEPGTSGVDLVSQVTTARPYVVGNGHHKVVAFDFGIKATILRCLSEIATVTVVPASTSFDEIVSLAPDGVFLSNGPGDPEAVTGAPQVISALVNNGTRVFGICLGHQIMGLAAGAKTLKMKFGHHGANHPVQDLDSKRVMITSQNHGFAIDESSLPANVRVTHRSLFDQSNQGIALTDAPAFSFQGHPEASPGPHDVAYLFDKFITLMEKR